MNALSSLCVGLTACSGIALAGEPVGDEQGQGAAPAQGSPAPEAPKQDGQDIRVYWKDGFRFETADKSFTAQIKARAQMDAAFFSGDDSDLGVDLEDGAEFRRIYFGLWGSIQDFDYAVEWDFANSSGPAAGDGPRPTDIYLAHGFWGVGRLQIGHFKEPQGLEELTSDLHTTFMERGLLGMPPVRNLGAQLSDSAVEDRLTWAAGLFRASSDAYGFDTGGDEYAVTGRVTYAPWYSDGGSSVGHVGLSASERHPNDDGTTITAKPHNNISPAIIATGAIDADSYTQVGAEAAAVFGRFSVQGEMIQAMFDGTAAAGDDPDLTVWYGYLSYFLTGEHRTYKLGRGVFDRVKIASPFDTGGWGAWELGVRYSSVDFSEATAENELDDITVGLNWYMTQNTKAMINYVHANSELTDGSADIVAFRLQYDI